MKKNIRIILIILLILIIGYLVLSWFCLDGRITYWTSFTENTIEESKKENLFVTNKLIVKTDGDSLKNWRHLFNLWTNKRYEIKYFGIIFYWTFENPSWRYLHIEPKSPTTDRWFRRRLIINNDTSDFKKGFTGGYESCCNWIPCTVGDTVIIQFHRAWQHDSIVGSLKIHIQ